MPIRPRRIDHECLLKNRYLRIKAAAAPDTIKVSNKVFSMRNAQFALGGGRNVKIGSVAEPKLMNRPTFFGSNSELLKAMESKFKFRTKGKTIY